MRRTVSSTPAWVALASFPEMISTIQRNREPSISIHIQPMALFNAMVASLTDYAIKGVFRYQGESNVGQPEGIVGNDVVVWCDAICNPVYIRYAWADNPVNPNLYNNEGLPASPFQVEIEP